MVVIMTSCLEVETKGSFMLHPSRLPCEMYTRQNILLHAPDSLASMNYVPTGNVFHLDYTGDSISTYQVHHQEERNHSQAL